MILDGEGEAFLIDGKLEVRLVLSQSPEVGMATRIPRIAPAIDGLRWEEVFQDRRTLDF